MARAKKRAMLKQYRTLLYLSVLVFLVGCTQQAIAPVDSPTPVITQVSTMIPSSEIADDEISNIFTINSLCPEISNDASSLADLKGTMVLAGDEISFENEKFSPDNDQTSILLFWNTSSQKGTIYQLPESQEYYYYVTSPDKEKLAFTQGKTLAISYDVIVLNHDGEESGRFTLPDDWNLFDWLNNEMLLVRQNRLQKDKKELVSVNPVNGEQQILPANFPNLYSGMTLVDWGALTIFDPTSTLALYPKIEENEVTSVLWNVRNNMEMGSISSGKWPRWSPDRKRLFIVADDKSTPVDVGHDEIVLIKSEGDATRATLFRNHLEHDIINLPVWSPNSRYVAFWLSTSVPIKTAKLAVLDTETSTVDLYCKEVDPFPYRMGENNTLGYAYYQVNSAPPIWSPDNKYLLIEDYQEFRSSTYLFDLQSHSITKIADDARPVGWLK